MHEGLRAAVRRVWQVSGTFIGFVLVAVGIVMLFLPMPGMVVLALGLGILAEREYAWARRHLERVKGWARRFGIKLK